MVVSPDAEFLQQIRSHLEEGGRFQVTGAASAHEALSLANSNFYEVVILDGEINDIPIVTFSRDLAALQTDLKVLVYPPNNDPKHPLMDGLATNGFLNKPFSGPEIGRALANIFSEQSAGPSSQVKQIDDLMKQWLQHPETGRQKAEQIHQSTTAESVLIVIKEQPTASAGSINDKLMDKVTEFLSRYWKDEENSELARFLRMDGDGSERFVYATRLISNVVLVLVYPFNTTIQQVRRELNQVKEDFQKSYPSTAELRQEIASRAVAEIQERNKALEAMQPFTGAISQSELDALKALQGGPPAGSTSPGISEEELASLNALIAEMPAPDPEPVTEAAAPVEAEKQSENDPGWLNALQQQVSDLQTSEKTPAPASAAEEPSAGEAQPVEAVEHPASPSPAPDAAAPQQPVSEAEPLPEIDLKFPWETDETEGGEVLPVPPAVEDQPASAPQSAETVTAQEVTAEIPPPPVLQELIDQAQPESEKEFIPPLEEPAAPEVVNLEDPTSKLPPGLKDFRFNYTCVLIPGDHTQFLARDLSERLGNIMPQFHLAQGWQLTSITIRPQYMLWTVAVPVGICPHRIIHHIRSLTSAHIFGNFPDIARNKTSEDFWSSTFLAVSGVEPPPVNLIFDFVAQAWKNQETVPAS